MTLEGASTATIHAVIAAREAAFAADREAGRPPDPSRLTLYTSEQAHSSVEKAVLALGLPRGNFRMIETDEAFRLRPEALAASIDQDREAGLRPFCVTATVGTTSTSSVDPVPAVATICEDRGLWLHRRCCVCRFGGHPRRKATHPRWLRARRLVCRQSAQVALRPDGT